MQGRRSYFLVLFFSLMAAVDVQAQANLFFEGFGTDEPEIEYVRVREDGDMPLLSISLVGKKTSAKPTANGNYFAEVTTVPGLDDNGSPIQGDRIKWNKGGGDGQFRDGSGHRMLIYLEAPSEFPLQEGRNFGFYYQTTLLAAGGLDVGRSDVIDAGGFGVHLVERGVLTKSKVWRIGADGAARGFSGASDWADIATSGWYLLETTWHKSKKSGYIDQLNQVIDPNSGELIYSKTIVEVARESEVAGVGLASLGNGDFDAEGQQVGSDSALEALAVDNLQTITEPYRSQMRQVNLLVIEPVDEDQLVVSPN